MSSTAYDRWHASKAEKFPVPEPTAPWHMLARKHLGHVEGLRILEIGCGRGAFARYLQDQGAEVVAADFSPRAVELARELGCRRSIVADIQDIPLPDQSFDLVISLETLEHVPDPDKGLQELVRVTKVGGRLLVTTPNYLSLVGLYRLLKRLGGRGKFTEGGQPINKPLTLVGRVFKLKRLGCRVNAVDGRGQILAVPFVGSFRLRLLEHPHVLMKWFGLRGLTVATRIR
jgi:SAM-dependent methyltransferase